MAGHSGILAMMSTLNAQGQRPVAIEGIILAGSYNPADGTVQVIMGHTLAAASFELPSGQQVQPTVVGASLVVTGWDQYGPIGGERCLLVSCGTQYAAFLEFDEDDSPGAPSGERWIVHRNPMNPTQITGYTKWTNDGGTVGDNTGGWTTLAGSYGKLFTAGGLSVTLNDDAGALTLNGASPTTANAIVRQGDLVAFLSSLSSALNTWASTNLQGGSGASGPTLSFTPTASPKSFSA